MRINLFFFFNADSFFLLVSQAEDIIDIPDSHINTAIIFVIHKIHSFIRYGKKELQSNPFFQILNL